MELLVTVVPRELGLTYDKHLLIVYFLGFQIPQSKVSAHFFLQLHGNMKYDFSLYLLYFYNFYY